jgi:hypothetical protein
MQTVFNSDWIAKGFFEAFKDELDRHAGAVSKMAAEAIVKSGPHDPADDDEDMLLERRIEEYFRGRIEYKIHFQSQDIFSWSQRLYSYVLASHGEADLPARIVAEFGSSGILKTIKPIVEVSKREIDDIIRECRRLPYSTPILDEYPNRCRPILEKYARDCARATVTTLAERIGKLPVSELNDLGEASNYDTSQSEPSKTRIRGVLQQISEDPSFADRDGIVPFQRSKNKLRVGSGKKLAIGESYRKELDRSLKRIRENVVDVRLGNKDRNLPVLFDEYEKVFQETRVADGAVISLWSLGVEIDKRMRVIRETSDESPIDRPTSIYVDLFLTAHMLYLQSFTIITDVSRDFQRATQLFATISESAHIAPSSLLRELARSPVFEPLTQHALRDVAKVTKSGPKSIGEKAIGLGVLRGSLQEMGGALIKDIGDAIDKAPEEHIEDVIKSTIAENELAGNIVGFFDMQKIRIATISQKIPVFFSWLTKVWDITS